MMTYPTNLAIDTAGRLYVPDLNNNRVLRFDNASKKGNGAAADAVLGHATYTDARVNNLDSIGLNEPTGTAVDPKSGAVYVVGVGEQSCSPLCQCDDVRFGARGGRCLRGAGFWQR